MLLKLGLIFCKKIISVARLANYNVFEFCCTGIFNSRTNEYLWYIQDHLFPNQSVLITCFVAMAALHTYTIIKNDEPWFS